MLRRINRKQSFERKTIVKEAEEMIETVEELNAFLSDLINDEVDVTAANGAGGLHDPNYGYITMTMKANEKDGETEISCLVPDIEAIDWSGYVDDVLKNIKKWNWHTDEEEGIINAMLECLTDYFLFRVGEDTKEVETFTLPISKDEVEDILFEDTNEVEKELERFVVDKFYDEIEKRANEKEESKQIRRCEITRKREGVVTEARMGVLEDQYPNVLEVVSNLNEKEQWALERILSHLTSGLERLKSDNRKDIFNALSEILTQHKDMEHLLKVCKRKYPFEVMWF